MGRKYFSLPWLPSPLGEREPFSDLDSSPAEFRRLRRRAMEMLADCLENRPCRARLLRPRVEEAFAWVVAAPPEARILFMVNGESALAAYLELRKKG